MNNAFTFRLKPSTTNCCNCTTTYAKPVTPRLRRFGNFFPMTTAAMMMAAQSPQDSLTCFVHTIGPNTGSLQNLGACAQLHTNLFPPPTFFWVHVTVQYSPPSPPTSFRGASARHSDSGTESGFSLLLLSISLLFPLLLPSPLSTERPSRGPPGKERELR